MIKKEIKEDLKELGLESTLLTIILRTFGAERHVLQIFISEVLSRLSGEDIDALTDIIVESIAEIDHMEEN